MILCNFEGIEATSLRLRKNLLCFALLSFAFWEQAHHGDRTHALSGYFEHTMPPNLTAAEA